MPFSVLIRPLDHERVASSIKSVKSGRHRTYRTPNSWDPKAAASSIPPFFINFFFLKQNVLRRWFLHFERLLLEFLKITRGIF